jgi:hypothetical protein
MFLKGFGEFINESESNVTYQDLKFLLELGISDNITDGIYRLIDQGKMNQDEILDWVTMICDKYAIDDWSITNYGRVNVYDDVNLSELELTKLPLRFGKIAGDFNCYTNYLTTLEGAPQKVGGTFSCFNNELTTLEGAPQNVDGDFICSNNYLTTLEGAPKRVDGDFWCYNNPLTSLDGIGIVDGHILSDIK